MPARTWLSGIADARHGGKDMPNFSTRLALVLAATVTVASPAMATIYQSHSVAVKLQDLDLREDGDVARLDRRIRIAATSACGRLDPRDLDAAPYVRRCRSDAIDAASRRAEVIVAAVRSGKDQRLAIRESLRVVAR